MNNNAIGIFDSGFGGLTVVKQLKILLPYEKIVYFGDNKRMPYGSLNNNILKKYAIQNIDFLLTKNVKMIIAACGTISSILLKQSEDFNFKVPVLNIIDPLCQKVVETTKNNNVGIIGTLFTIQNSIISKKINLLNSHINIFSKACPLLAPIIQYSLYTKNIITIKKILLKYLLPLKNQNIDTLVLACTHYPILIKLISNIMGNNIKIIDPSILMAEYIFEFLNNKNLFNAYKEKKKISFFISGNNIAFNNFGSNFFKNKICSKTININKY